MREFNNLWDVVDYLIKERGFFGQTCEKNPCTRSNDLYFSLEQFETAYLSCQGSDSYDEKKPRGQVFEWYKLPPDGDCSMKSHIPLEVTIALVSKTVKDYSELYYRIEED